MDLTKKEPMVKEKRKLLPKNDRKLTNLARSLHNFEINA